MITFYMKASDGSFCKCVMKSWDDVNYALLALHWGMGEDGKTFEIIEETEFTQRINGNIFENISFGLLIPKETNRISGYYTEYHYGN